MQRQASLMEGRTIPQMEARKYAKKSEEKDDNKDKVNLYFAQMEGNCYCCGKIGHKSPLCHEKANQKKSGPSTKPRAMRKRHPQYQIEAQFLNRETATHHHHQVRTRALQGGLERMFQCNPPEIRNLILLDNQ